MSNINQGSSSIFTYAPLNPSNETLNHQPPIHLGQLNKYHVPPPPPPVVVGYRECQKNHAASMGTYVVDGCGEFMPNIGEQGTPEGLICAACKCHHSFHRREIPLAAAVSQASPYRQCHPGWRPLKKRFRTKFTEEQKQNMHSFAKKLGWKIQKKDEQEILEFCNEVGVNKKVLKVWMRNSKQACKKK